MGKDLESELVRLRGEIIHLARVRGAEGVRVYGLALVGGNFRDIGLLVEGVSTEELFEIQDEVEKLIGQRVTVVNDPSGTSAPSTSRPL